MQKNYFFYWLCYYVSHGCLWHNRWLLLMKRSIQLQMVLHYLPAGYVPEIFPIVTTGVYLLHQQTVMMENTFVCKIMARVIPLLYKLHLLI